MPRKEEILTTKEVCRLLKIGRVKLYRLVRETDLPCYRLGDAQNSPLRYKRSDLMNLLHRNRVMFGSEMD